MVLDMDEPYQVVAAAGKFTRAITTATEQVDTTTAGLTLPNGPSSPLDYKLVGTRNWITETFDNATGITRGKAYTAFLDAFTGAYAFGAVDQHSRDRISGAEV
jgi:hypothetical protein